MSPVGARPPPRERLTLVSHHLCPYVQRAAIALAEKGVPFERCWVNLADKPDWFTAVSPLGKVPLLHVGSTDVDSGSVDAPLVGCGTTIFESAVIVEYLEETQPRPLHPVDPLERARHRAWMEFGSAILNAIARLYNAPDAAALDAQANAISALFDQVENDLASRDPAWNGPFFADERFSLVDAVFGPAFRYFDTFERDAGLHLLDRHERVGRWRTALAERPSMREAIDAGYPKRLSAFLRERRTAISELMGTG